MSQIHITNGQQDTILDFITANNIISDNHKKSLENTLETYQFITFADKRFSQYLEKRNRIIIPDEDETLREFVIAEAIKYKDREGYKAQVYANASYLELKKASILYPSTFTGSASQHAGRALNATGWQVGIVESNGTRTLSIENYTNPYEFLKRIAREFGLELRFRIEHNGNKVTGRYVDLLERVGIWQGREVEFGKDLDGIRRIEKQDIVTALLGLGPEDGDGNRIEVLVEDEEALKRWGRVDEHGNLHHLIEPYEIQSDRTEMTEQEARQYTRTALDKRIDTQVTYETTIIDLENVPGMENKKIRFGDTIKIKDTKFNPPLYLEARVFEQTRSIKSKAKKDIKLGDYTEYTEEEVNALFRQFQDEIRKRIERMVLATIVSNAGTVFKNGIGSTQLEAKTFLSGHEVDEDGTKYEYRWHKFDKDGHYVAGFFETGKRISVNADTIDEKASYRIEIILNDEVLTLSEITLSNVFDGEEGEPGQSLYTWMKYADSPTSGMSDSPENKKYIGLAYNKETPVMSTDYGDYTWSKIEGEQGVPGEPGDDGTPRFTWIKYADDENGSGMSDSSEGKTHIGLAFNKETPNESTDAGDYEWSYMPQNIEIGGRNYFVIHESKEDTLLSWATGRENTEIGSLASGFISAKTGENFVVGPVGTNQLFYYDENKQHIGGYGNQHGGESILIPDDEGIRFIRVVFRYNFLGNYSKNDVVIQKGNKATDWTPAPEDVQHEIDIVDQKADNAQESADGKNTVFRQSTTPSTSNRKIGDLWFKTDEGNLMHVWTGEWTKTKFDYQALSVGKLSAISADLGNVTAGDIQGVTVNLGNGKFIVDENGNVSFAGDLDGASGTFNGIVSSGILKTTMVKIGPDNPSIGNYLIGMEIKNPVRISDEVYQWGEPFVIEVENNHTKMDFPGALNLWGVGLNFNGGAVETIVSRGSNANGEYVRYASGIQICWCNPVPARTNRGAASGIYYSDIIRVDFPASFDRFIGVIVNSDGTLRWADITNTPLLSSCQVRQFAVGEYNTDMDIRVMAIGWWK